MSTGGLKGGEWVGQVGFGLGMAGSCISSGSGAISIRVRFGSGDGMGGATMERLMATGVAGVSSMAVCGSRVCVSGRELWVGCG